MEKELQKQIEDYLKILAKRYPIWFYHPREGISRKDKYTFYGGSGTAGIPDLIICVYGEFMAIELKYGKNKLTKKQEEVKKEIERAGGFYFIAQSLEEIQMIIETGYGLFL